MTSLPPKGSARLLDRIDEPRDFRNLSVEELQQLAEEVRREMIEAVSLTGGHLGAGLGVVVHGQPFRFCRPIEQNHPGRERFPHDGINACPAVRRQQSHAPPPALPAACAGRAGNPVKWKSINCRQETYESYLLR